MSRNTQDLLVLLLGTGTLVYLFWWDDISRYFRQAVLRTRNQAPGWFTWRTAMPLMVAIALAVMMRTPLLGVYYVVVAILFIRRAYNKARLAQLAKLNRQVARMVFAFRSIFKLQPVIWAALREIIGRLEEPLKGWVAATLDAYMVTNSDEEAFAVLRSKSNNHYLHQFVFILELSGAASEETVVAALDNLAERLRRYEDLQRETEIELASVASQTRIIQMIGLGVLFLVALVAPLRNEYASSVVAQIVYMILASVAVATSFYIDGRMDSLKGSVL